MDSGQGFLIKFDVKSYKENKRIVVNGLFSTYVNCGSQYAIWHQFPVGVNYTLKDLDSGRVYESINRELSISWSGDEIYKEYAKKPCNQIVSESFSILLNEVYFREPSKIRISNFELHAEYVGHKSNTLVFKNIPFYMNE